MTAKTTIRVEALADTAFADATSAGSTAERLAANVRIAPRLGDAGALCPSQIHAKDDVGGHERLELRPVRHVDVAF